MVRKGIAGFRFRTSGILRSLAFCIALGIQHASHAKPDGATPDLGIAPERKQQDPLLQLIRSLTPDQKAKLMESIKTWQTLGPELKNALRAREKSLRKTLNDEVGTALEGVSFTKEQRETFEKRYKEERRKLESNLRAEFEARRRTALEELTLSLKKSILQAEATQ